MTSAEVVFPASGKICPLPDLPSSRREHSQDGLVMCGAKEDKTSCLTLSEVGWTKSHDLINERFNHISWQMEEGILLMGGASSPDSTELGDQILKTIPRITQYSVRPDGTTEESFSLKYSIRSIVKSRFEANNFVHSHSSCSIPFDDHVLVVGGNSLDAHERVTKYGLAGWLEDFPNLITGRRKHGCGQYTDSSGRQVRLDMITSSVSSLLSGLPCGWRREQARAELPQVSRDPGGWDLRLDTCQSSTTEVLVLQDGHSSQHSPHVR